MALLFSASIFADGENVIEYSQIFIPEDKIDDAPFVSPSLPYSRQQLEQDLARLEQRSKMQNNQQPHLSRIVLKAKLEGRQLTSGQGVFTLHPRSDQVNSILLNPLTLAVSSLRWADDTNAVLFTDPRGENRLLIPSETDSNSYEQLQFRWSLQSRRDVRNGIVFDIALPPCLSIELQIELPDSKVPTVSAGLVLPNEKEESVETGFRMWRILLGHHSQTILTISADKTLAFAGRKMAIRQATNYLVRQEGLTAEVRIMFNEADPRPEELLLELELPLRLSKVHYGNRPVTWTGTEKSLAITEVRVDLSPFAEEEQPEDLVIEALGPLRGSQRWVLPRVRVTSPNTLWLATRAGVSVYPPLRTRNMVYHQAVQVTPNRPFEWVDRELFAFQFFQDDAQIELEVVHSTPQVTVSSATQVNWNDNEIQSSVYLDCSVTEGERFTLNFPVSAHWVIDSVIPYPLTDTVSAEGDVGFSWSVLDDVQPQVLSIQLNRPLRHRQPVALQIKSRFINTQTQFRLEELSPLVLFHRHGESHRIATQFDFINHQHKTNTDASTFGVSRTVVIGGNSIPLLGDIYPLDYRAQDIYFELEQMRPKYIAEISGNIDIENNALIPRFHILCTPMGSSISRVFVHFTPVGQESTPRQWEWSVSDSRPYRVYKTSPEELKALLPLSEQQNWNEDLGRGEIWEVRFDELRTEPFSLSAVSLIPFADSTAIPFASVPLASSQKGELTIASPQHFDYRIIGARLDSIPIAPAAWDRYQSIRAAFRYNPQEELRRSQHSPITLQRIMPDEWIETAWVWSLRLDSQHDSEGTVQNRALFLVENQGKDMLQITLPSEIDVADVFAVWRDSQQIPWQLDEDRQTIDVALPVGQRFVSIVIEYSYQDLPLVRQRRLRPHYPTVNVPVLSGSWISWFPPEFDVSLRHTAGGGVEAQSSHQFTLSKSADYLLSHTYRSFLGLMWNDVLFGEQRRLEAETAAKYFFAEVANTFQNNPVATWGDLIGNEGILSAVRARLANDNTSRVIESKLLMDKQALTLLGITPATPIEIVGSVNEKNVRKKIFEDAGLILLVATRTRTDGIREYVFAITTPTTLSLHQQFQPLPAGHCVRAVPFEIFDSVSQSSQWILDSRWLSETTLSSIPWSISTQVLHRTAFISDWKAYELPINSEQSLYIVHHQKFLALQWITFLFVVLVTSRKPFSSPFVLLILLVIFELIARSVMPCHVGIPSGAFLGVLVSFAFVLIRSQMNPREPQPERSTRHDSTECSVSFVQTQLPLRTILLFGLLSSILAWFSVSAQAQTLPEHVQNSSQKEPYRIFYPTDAEGRIVGENVLVPVELLNILHQNIQEDAPAMLPHWSIIEALYQGSLIRSTLGQIECSDDFKATYEIYLDSPSTTISLPNLPAVQGRYFWNGQPIQPIWYEDEQNDTLSFAIENETPGRHTLELGLSPQAALQSDGETLQIAFAIPKVPHSMLRLTVPPDIPPVLVPDALGAVTANTAQLPVVTAELGATQQLSLLLVDDPNTELVREVEQFFRMWIKPRQIVIEALFRFRIDGGSIQSLTIQTDPRWTLSGQFRCDHPIVPRPETGLDSRIDFQSPVSGTVTLEADFVWRGDFYGVGNLRRPEFNALKTHVTRSMLAVYADAFLELNPPIEGRSSGFESGWQGTLIPKPTDVSPEAEYDLTQTTPDWTLNLRAKKIIPDVAVSQSVQFDAGESQVHIVGEFLTDSTVFQQSFSADRRFQIGTLEVRDSQGAIIESRIQQIAPATMPEQYLIFFKRPAVGQYTIIVGGFFETETSEAISPQSVPVFTFGETQTTKLSLNLFRTSAVIAEIPSEQSDWMKASVLSVAPESFAHSIPLGTWQRAEPTKATPELNALQFAPLLFSLSPNRPKVKCKTVLSLQTDTDEQWTMTLDFTGNITDGELRSLRFQWDERCGVIQPIEPGASWSISPLSGQQVLEVFLNEPIRGEQHLKIVVPLNVTGTPSLPNVFPLPGTAYQFESEITVVLPLRQDNELVPWELNQLVKTEEEQQMAETQRYRAVDNDFSAVINQGEAKLVAVFYDIGFLIKHDGTVIGVVTVDLRNRGQDSFVLQMPEGYEPIQISSAGLMLDRAPLPEGNRWQIHIGTSDYPQRLSILFRTSVLLPLKRWNREQIVSTLQFPFLEGVTIHETLWTIAFEGNLPLLNVAVRDDLFSSTGKESNLGEHTPLVGIEAALSLIGVNFVRQNNLLQILNSMPVSGKQEEMQRWFQYWSDEWKTVSDKVDFQISHLPLTLHNVRPKLIVRPVNPTLERLESVGIVRPFLDMMGARTQESLRLRKEQTVREKFSSVIDTVSKQPVPILNSQVYWQGRATEEARYLFGTEEGSLRAVRLTSTPSVGGWIQQFSKHIWLWVSLSLLIPIFVLLSVRWVYMNELWLQFPHFWGMTLGVLLWIFLPKSFLGLFIIVWTFISLFRPSWTRHRYRMYS